MGNFEPFTGYSVVLRIIIFGAVPAFTIMQYFRLKRALHVFQLEGYKRDRFLRWCRDNRARARWLRAAPQKKPLVMTGRARRLLMTSVVLTPLLILAAAGIAHVALGGWPIDLLTWAAAMLVLFFGTSRFLVLVDVLLSPVQRSINERYLRAARRRLEQIAPRDRGDGFVRQDLDQIRYRGARRPSRKRAGDAGLLQHTAWCVPHHQRITCYGAPLLRGRDGRVQGG